MMCKYAAWLCGVRQNMEASKILSQKLCWAVLLVVFTERSVKVWRRSDVCWWQMDVLGVAFCRESRLGKGDSQRAVLWCLESLNCGSQKKYKKCGKSWAHFSSVRVRQQQPQSVIVFVRSLWTTNPVLTPRLHVTNFVLTFSSFTFVVGVIVEVVFENVANVLWREDLGAYQHQEIIHSTRFVKRTVQFQEWDAPFCPKIQHQKKEYLFFAVRVRLKKELYGCCFYGCTFGMTWHLKSVS